MPDTFQTLRFRGNNNECTGRNGYHTELSECQFYLIEDQRQIVIMPVSKTGRALNAGMTLAVEDVPAFIKVLNGYMDRLGA